MKKIAIVSSNDNVWNLSAWDKTLPELSQNYSIKGFWVSASKPIEGSNLNEIFWYLKCFGFINTFKLGLFMFIVLFRCFFDRNKERNFKELCNKHRIPLHECNSPNDDRFVAWVLNNDIDIVIIMLDHILKLKIIDAPNIGILNKHAALLPANKGILPYIWAYINNNNQQGVSFHRVEEKIDSGEIYFQTEISKSYSNSLIQFYLFVFQNYSSMLQTALKNMVNGVVTVPKSTYFSSYHSLPSKEDMKQFTKMNGKIIRCVDLLSAFKL